MNALLYTVVTAAFIYLVAMLWLYLGQRGRVYRPERDIITTPDTAGYEYEDVTLVTGDGVHLNAWFVPSSDERAVLLFFHGNNRNISHCMDSIEIFNRLGCSVFLFDYRGYGQSEGRPGEAGTYRDAEAAWRYLVERRGVSSGNIVMLGRSLGAAVASWLAVRHTPRALVIESTFTSLPDIGAELHPWLPARLLARYEYPVKRNLRSVHCPVLVVHSRDDELIPLSHGRALYEGANHPKSFLEIRGMHYDGFRTSGQDYVEGLARFFDECLGVRGKESGCGDTRLLSKGQEPQGFGAEN